MTTTKAHQMAVETGAGIAVGLKLGALGGLAILAASVLGTVIGLRVVPPVKGREVEDVSTRLLCGLLSSCTLGIYAAYRFISADPGWLVFWLKVYAGAEERDLLALVSAGLPFVLLAALPGFWLVAGFMRYAQRKASALAEGQQ